MSTKNYSLIDSSSTTKFILILCAVSIFIFNSCSAYNNMNLVDIGNRYFIEHEYDKALEFYEEAIKKGYKTFDIFYNLGFIYYYEKRELKKAEELFNEGLLLYPNSDILHSVLSQLYFELDDYSKAMKEYKQAVELAKDRIITINANLAKNLLKKQGKSEKEIAGFFIEIINYNPNDRLALYEVAEYDKNQGKYTEALGKYKKIIELDANMRNVVLRDMGICYYKLRDYKLAQSYLEEARKNGDYVSENIFKSIREKNVSSNAK